MTELIHIIILSFIQGVTEFLPISSSAHLILVPAILGWEQQGILLDVSMHFGSLLAISLYYFKNVKEFSNIQTSKNYISIKKLFIGSLPVLCCGYFFYDFISNNLRSVEIIGIFTILVALLILSVEFFRKKFKDIKAISNYDMLIIGLFQALALIPGTSRSAIIIFAALLIGYNKKSAIIIALMLSFPVILVAMIYEVFTLDYYLINYEVVMQIITAVSIAFIVSYFVIKNFISYINIIGFYPFMIYRIILGITLLAFFT
jgi:undecaprenyl-diphosphatase|tara:strand:- start:544 stop:1323 length:780 start_codon:yes stop_codon:yes gene_type:complete